jgi:hypothetical protein
MPSGLAITDGLDNQNTCLKTSMKLSYNPLVIDEYAGIKLFHA